MFAWIVLSTTPMDSESCSRNACCTGVKRWNEASSTTAITWSSKRTGRTITFTGEPSPRPELKPILVTQAPDDYVRRLGDKDRLQLQRRLSDERRWS